MLEVDVLAFGPHPDDVELGCGGTLIKLADRGCRFAIVDLTRGEMGTRGTVETRAAEAAAAAKVLGATVRENLGLPDGSVRNDHESRRKVVEAIRTYRPKLVLAPYHQDRHPDHYHASQLIYEATFVAGLRRYETGQESYRPLKFAYYMRWYEFEPTFIVDITEQFDRKMDAIWSYASQFKPPDRISATSEGADDPETRLTTPEYHWKLVHRMAYYGSLIQSRYGEGFLICGQLEMDDPLGAQFLSF